MVLTAVLLKLRLARRVGDEASDFTVCRDLEILGTCGIARARYTGTGMAHYSAEVAILILTESVSELIEDSVSESRGSSYISGVATVVNCENTRQSIGQDRGQEGSSENATRRRMGMVGKDPLDWARDLS